MLVKRGECNFAFSRSLFCKSCLIAEALARFSFVLLLLKLSSLLIVIGVIFDFNLSNAFKYSTPKISLDFKFRFRALFSATE